MIHLQKEIEHIKKMTLSLSAVVEESVQKAVQAFEERDVKLARRVINDDDQIDEMEVEVEEECLKILALHQPVAIDLRFIIAVLKINNDLERIGDLAVNLAERASVLASMQKIQIPIDVKNMGLKVKGMLKKALDSLVNLDGNLAREVCAADDEVDEIHRGMYEKVQSALESNPRWLRPLVQLLAIPRYLERIADHATNIAEDVIYMIEGQIYRHVK